MNRWRLLAVLPLLAAAGCEQKFIEAQPPLEPLPPAGAQEGIAAPRVNGPVGTAAGTPAALTSNWYAAAPYLMPLDNNPPDAGAVMDATGLKAFQLAFLLMNLKGIAEPAHGDREGVDLLFFPTGGGKSQRKKANKL